jgi:tetratricopeptide (TPR) repeat protein
VHRNPHKFWRLAGLNLGVLLVFLARGYAVAEPGKANTNDFPGYVGPESCEGCHAEAYQRWSQSAHGLAEALMTSTMRSAFNPPRNVLHGTETATVCVSNGQFQIVTLGPESNRQPFRVERVIGHSPLVQFLTPFPGGRYQVQEASFDPKSNQWFYVYGDDLRHPGEYGHWTGRGMNWNSSCTECHNTRIEKNYDAATDSYHTTMAGMAVGCEACHGPLQKHLDWQREHPKSTAPDPTVAPLSPERLVGMCGSCHSRNTVLDGDFVPGESFYDHYVLETLDPAGHWYPDGQIKDEDYEFAPFLGSKMYQAGVTCIDCHTRDVGKPQLTGNDLCMRCHNGGYPKAPVIDIAGHGHHKLNDKGSDCVGCHMPVTVYMQRHPRHDHGFAIPDPLLTKELNIPNACNRCHADKSADWALKYTEQWYGAKMNRHTRERARWIAAGASGEAGADEKLIRLLADTNQPAYWRVVAATFLAQWASEPTTQAALLAQLKNEHPLVREKAVRALEPDLGDAKVSAALNLMLADPVRNVRVAAAWVLRATVDLQGQAGKDLLRMMDLEADQPTGQFEAAMFCLSRRQPAEALAHLKKATAWDPLSPPFLCTQAQVQDELGQLTEALKTLDQAEAAVPDDPHIPYVRAEILARNSRYDEARAAANRALKTDPAFKPAAGLLQSLPPTRQ